MTVDPKQLRRQFCMSAALLPVACAANRTVSGNGHAPPGSGTPAGSNEVRNEVRNEVQADRADPQAPSSSSPQDSSTVVAESEWIGPGLAIHGGAGTIGRDMPLPVQESYRAALRAVVRLGLARIEAGQDCLDVAEGVIMALEDHPLFNAGHGAVYTAQGTHELDAAIMRGTDLACGAITGVTTVKNPIQLARAVMDRTPHVLLSGTGAEKFADTIGVARVENRYFDTEHRREAWERAQKHAQSPVEASSNKMGTVGVAVMDRRGKLAAATSTGGMTNKMYGRVGDVPIIGAGTYANDDCCAISCTGHGEQFIRHSVAHEVSALMRWTGRSLQDAADHVMTQVLSPGDGGLVAIDRHGRTVFSYNSAGMYRGRATLGGGEPEVAIWES